jgi:hypothetical protein
MTLRGRVVRLEELPAGQADRYEIGVAFDLDSGQAEEDLLLFLEQAGPTRPLERT